VTIAALLRAIARLPVDRAAAIREAATKRPQTEVRERTRGEAITFWLEGTRRRATPRSLHGHSVVDEEPH
jgi:hypothetical protein